MTILAALIGLALTTPAQAGYGPRVEVSFDAWSPGYRPAPRAGFVWIDGQYDGWGEWCPGYWQPVHTRAGYHWVPGYWSGRSYVSGFWRPRARAGYQWSAGRYDRGRWVSGGWVSSQRHRAVNRGTRYVRNSPRPRGVVSRPASRPSAGRAPTSRPTTSRSGARSASSSRGSSARPASTRGSSSRPTGPRR